MADSRNFTPRKGSCDVLVVISKVLLTFDIYRERVRFFHYSACNQDNICFCMVIFIVCILIDIFFGLFRFHLFSNFVLNSQNFEVAIQGASEASIPSKYLPVQSEKYTY